MSTLRLSATLNGETRQWALDVSPAGVGRSSRNALHLPDATVSKEHAELVRDGGEWRIRDLGSRNGTRVNGHEASGPTPLKPGDWVEVGHVMLRVAEDEPTSANISTSKGIGSKLRLRVTDVLQKPPASGGGDRQRLVHLLAEAGQLLVLPRPLRETCEEILKFVEKAVPASRLVILLRERPGAEPVQVAARRPRGGAAITNPAEPLALSQTIMGMVLNENTAVITSDAATDPRFMQQHSIIAQAIHSAMAVPLFDNERVLGILYVDSTHPSVNYGQDELELLTLLGNMAAVKLTNARLLEAEEARQRMAQELATATRIQTALLPPAPDNLPGWDCHARIETCYEVGGDLYDFHRRADGTLVVFVGDVSGKGMGAALLMSSILSSARVLYDESPNPLALVQRLNQVMHRGTDARSFVTVFVGFLDPESGLLRYVNAGHPEPHLVRPGRVRTLEATGIPVAMLPEFPWTMGEVVIEPGELLALFSDGIPEAQHGDAFYDFERTSATLQAAAAAERGVAGIADRLIADVDAFMAGVHRTDDVTLVLLRRTAAEVGTA
ncbi:MAG TPA: SpoIIE family protein phosphatase [Candidatus Eisenbacteria bacterium]|nr:SpoIIE family protein phosphatase [Candidatus Eisenbacteria bacterium]